MSGENVSAKLQEEDSQVKLEVEKWTFQKSGEEQNSNNFESKLKQNESLSPKNSESQDNCEKESESTACSPCNIECCDESQNNEKCQETNGSQESQAQQEKCCSDENGNCVYEPQVPDAPELEKNENTIKISTSISDPKRLEQDTANDLSADDAVAKLNSTGIEESQSNGKISNDMSADGAVAKLNSTGIKESQSNGKESTTIRKSLSEKARHSFHSMHKFSRPNLTEQSSGNLHEDQQQPARKSIAHEFMNRVSSKSKNKEEKEWSVVNKELVDRMQDESGIPDEPAISILERYRNATGSSFHVKKADEAHIVKWTEGPLMETFMSFQNQLQEFEKSKENPTQNKSKKNRKDEKSKLDIFVSKPDPDAFQNLEVRILGIGLKAPSSKQDDNASLPMAGDNSGVMVRSLTPGEGVTSLACILSESKNEHRIKSLHKALFGDSLCNVQMIIEKSLFIPLKQPKIETYPAFVPLSSNFLLESNQGVFAGTSMKIPLLLRDWKWALPSKARFKVTKSGNSSDLVVVRKFLLWKPEQTWPEGFENKESKKSWQEMNSVGVIFVRFVGITGQHYSLFRSPRVLKGNSVSPNLVSSQKSNKIGSDNEPIASVASFDSNSNKPFTIAPTDVAPLGSYVPFDKLHPTSLIHKMTRPFSSRKNAAHLNSSVDNSVALCNQLEKDGINNPKELLKDKNFMVITGIATP